MFGTGIKNTKVTRKQARLLGEHVGQEVLLKADRVLGVGRERVKLVAVDPTTQTATVLVPDWGEETAYYFMFVRLY